MKKIIAVITLAVILAGCSQICAQLPNIPIGEINGLCPAATPTPGV